MSKVAIHKHQATPYRGKARKEKLVAEFAEKISKASGMVFANYQHLSHKQLENLKRTVKKLDAEFIATKNSLILRALEKINLTEDYKKFFHLPTATLFMYGDPIGPIKELAKLIKETKLPKIKFGYLNGRTISANEVEKLATLPTISQLQAQLVYTLNSPIQRLHRALSWNIAKFALTLNAIAQKKS
jgi:large subunit ribosomal protein L10